MLGKLKYRRDTAMEDMMRLHQTAGFKVQSPSLLSPLSSLPHTRPALPSLRLSRFQALRSLLGADSLGAAVSSYGAAKRSGTR